jgi:aminocarboxymuconate-semialdehyde decarboxylase
MVGAPFEDTVAALQLVMSGLTLRHPRIRVIVPHLGGTLPFLLGRIEGALGRRRARGGPVAFDGDSAPLFRKLWYDTVNAHRAALRCACESFGVDRLLLGTDFPYMRDAQLQYLLDVPYEIGLSEAEVTALLGGTAQTLLGLPTRSA